MNEELDWSYVVNPAPERGEMDVLSAGYQHCKAGTFEPYRMTNVCLIHHVTSGSGTFHYGDRSFQIRTGESFFIFPRELYSYSPDANDPWSYQFLALSGTRIAQMLTSLGLSSMHPVLKPPRPRRVSLLFRQIYRTLSERKAGYNHEAAGLVRLALAQYASGAELTNPSALLASSQADRRIKSAIQWLNRHYTYDISLQDLADQQGCTLDHLTKKFKSLVGVTPKEYLTRLRLEAAKSMLYSELPIKVIASKVGYLDPFYFSRLFKKEYNLSPEAFRQQIH
ncbi:helix-turn-helix domain-containing protein [Paenibacillus sp. GCM10023252]|uniref:AraC family transcriptional regulator n=1 Tax=Paenibacillus sp. GCM10023252 TaxID=3252649 RepID=UPI003611CA64